MVYQRLLVVHHNDGDAIVGITTPQLCRSDRIADVHHRIVLYAGHVRHRRIQASSVEPNATHRLARVSARRKTGRG